MTIVYLVLFYILTGSLVYLYGRKRTFYRFKPLVNDLLRFLGFIYKPVIYSLLAIDDFKDEIVTRNMQRRRKCIKR